MPLTWSDEFSLGFKDIDSQHRQFVEALNELYQAIYDNKSKADILVMLNKIRDLEVLHFTTEEFYFSEFHYDRAEEHIATHQDFKKKIAQIIDDFESGKTAVDLVLVDFLEDWLADHVMNVDKKYVECFHEHGLH